MKKIQPQHIVKGLTWLLITGGVCFEIFNAVTTYQALDQIIGQVLMAGALATAMVAVDIGGLARIATPTTNSKDEPMFVKILAVVWVIVAIGNAFLTWWGVAKAMETTGGRTPTEMRSFVVYIPLIIAGIVLCVRACLIYSMGLVLDRMINGHNFMPQRRVMSQGARPPIVTGQQPQPTYNSTQN
jgi:uncharacterized membrane protein YidH (DUF202 family)